MARGGPRSGAGRKRKDPQLKLVTGTYRPDRDAKVNEDVPLAPMTAPIHLSEIARQYFSDIAGMLEAQKRSSPHYAEHVALLAQRLEQIAMFQAVIETEGCTFTTETVAQSKDGKVATVKVMKRGHPAVAMLSDAMRHAQSLLGELMLNPSAALKMASGHKAQDDNEFGDF